MSYNATPFSDLTNAAIACPWNANFTWDARTVSPTALHNLTFVCPFQYNNTYEGAR